MGKGLFHTGLFAPAMYAPGLFRGVSSIAPPAPFVVIIPWSQTTAILLWSQTIAALLWSQTTAALPWSLSMVESNIDVPWGTNIPITFTNSASVDTTGWTVTLYLVPLRKDVPAVSINGSISGTTFTFANTPTTVPAPGSYRFSMRRTNAGAADCLARGIITFTEDAGNTF